MLDLPPTLDILDLKKPTPENIPKQRLSDPAKASAIVSTLVYANRERADIDATVKGMLDGNAPFSWGELVKQGQSHRTNVNFREGEAMMSDAMTPFYDLFAESDTYAKIELDEPDADKRAEFSRIVTEEFDALLKEWAGFDWNMQAILFDMVAYGKGFAFWPDKTAWQFRAIRQSRVLVPDQTPSDIDQLEILVVRQDCTVHELYNPIRDEKRARSIGWNPRAVLEACANAMPRDETGQSPFNYELLQQELRNHDLYATTRSSTVRIAHIFVKEFNNRVTHLIVEEQYGVQSPARGVNEKKPEGVFLYKKVGRFDSFREVVCPIFYDIGDGTWHSIKGLAIKLHPFIAIKNRLNCAVVDNAFLNMSVLVKPLTAKGYNGQAIVQVGPLSVLPSDVEIQNWGLSGRLEEGLAVERALTSKLESNLGQYRKPLLEKQGNPVTATQVTYDAAKEASLGKGAVNRFYAQADMLFEGVYKRAANPNLVDDGRGQNAKAMEFQRRCINRGVPKTKLIKPRFIRASRNIGNGSIFLRQQTVLQTAQLVPMMNEAGRQAWLDDAIAVMAGTEAVARWNPKVEVSQNLADEQAWAVMENAVLNMGAPVRWTQTQNNVIHATTHIKAAVDAVNSLNPQNGNTGDPMQVVAFLDAAGPHIVLHLEQMRRDPNQAQMFKALEGQFKQLAKIADQIRKQAEQAMMQRQRQQQQNAARQQQVATSAQLDRIELENKMRNQNAKTAQQLEQKAAKSAQNMAIADAQSASKITRANMEAAAKAREPEATAE